MNNSSSYNYGPSFSSSQIDAATISKYPGIIKDSSGWYRAREHIKLKLLRGKNEHTLQFCIRHGL